MGILEGIGTELGLFNMLLYAITAAFVGMYAKRIKFLLTTDWEKYHARHKKLWAQYMRGKLDEASTDDFVTLEDD